MKYPLHLMRCISHSFITRLKWTLVHTSLRACGDSASCWAWYLDRMYYILERFNCFCHMMRYNLKNNVLYCYFKWLHIVFLWVLVLNSLLFSTYIFMCYELLDISIHVFIDANISTQFCNLIIFVIIFGRHF